MAVDAIAQMSCIIATNDWNGRFNTLGVFTAAVDEDVHWRSYARNLQVHAPSTT